MKNKFMTMIMTLSFAQASFAISEKDADQLYAQRNYLTVPGLVKLDEAIDMYQALAAQAENPFQKAKFLCRAADGTDGSGQAAYVVELKASQFQKAQALTENALSATGFWPLNEASEDRLKALPAGRKAIVMNCLYRHMVALGNFSQITGVTEELKRQFAFELGLVAKVLPEVDFFGGIRIMGKLKSVFPDLVPTSKSAVELLKEALVLSESPVKGVSQHLLTHVYLAQALILEGRIPEARQTLRAAVWAPLDQVHPGFRAENEYFQLDAVILLNQLR